MISTLFFFSLECHYFGLCARFLLRKLTQGMYMEECQTTVSVNPSGLRILRQKTPKVESSRQQQKTTLNVCSFLKKQFLGKGVFTLCSQEKIS